MKQCCDYTLVERIKQKKEEKFLVGIFLISLIETETKVQIRLSSVTDYLNHWQTKGNIFGYKNAVNSLLSIGSHFLWTKTKLLSSHVLPVISKSYIKTNSRKYWLLSFLCLYLCVSFGVKDWRGVIVPRVHLHKWVVAGYELEAIGARAQDLRLIT